MHMHKQVVHTQSWLKEEEEEEEEEEVEEEEEEERLPAQGHKMRGGRRRPRGQHEVL